MNFYSSVNLLTELIMMAMTIHVTKYKGFTKEQKAWYLLTFIAIMVCSLAEFAVHCGYYYPGLAIPLSILTILQFSIAPLLINELLFIIVASIFIILLFIFIYLRIISIKLLVVFIKCFNIYIVWIFISL